MSRKKNKLRKNNSKFKNNAKCIGKLKQNCPEPVHFDDLHQFVSELTAEDLFYLLSREKMDA